MPEILALAKEAASAAIEKKAKNVVILKMGEVTIITDYFVIASAANKNQAQAIAESVEKAMDAKGVKRLSREGLKEARWVLLDYGNVVIHIFQEEVRDFYNLEAIWADTTVISCDS